MTGFVVLSFQTICSLVYTSPSDLVVLRKQFSCFSQIYYFYSNCQYFINYINVPNALEEVPLVQLFFAIGL